MYEPKSVEEIKEIGKDLKDFGTGYQPPKIVMAKDMTLRDYFAGQIISNLASRNDDMSTHNLIAFLAFKFADEMMKERNNGNS
jgi:hypothetical protein